MAMEFEALKNRNWILTSEIKMLKTEIGHMVRKKKDDLIGD
jgi:hypothetical protein